MKPKRWGLIAGAVVGWHGAVAAFPMTVFDDLGVSHTFAAPPRRIVTLLPSHSEAVWALGGGAKLVGVDRYTNWPAQLAHLPRVGGVEEAQIEAIAALKPDLVLASPKSRSTDRLEALGFRVLRIKSETHDDVRRTLDLLARLLDRPEEGERVWQQTMQEVAAAARLVPPALRGRRVYFELGHGSHAAGAASFIGETLSQLGLVNIVPVEMGPFPRMSPEFVVRARPDVVVGTRVDVDTMPGRPGYRAVPAIAEDRRCGYEPGQFDVITRPGPRLGEAARLLAECLRRIDRSRNN